MTDFHFHYFHFFVLWIVDSKFPDSSISRLCSTLNVHTYEVGKKAANSQDMQVQISCMTLGHPSQGLCVSSGQVDAEKRDSNDTCGPTKGG